MDDKGLRKTVIELLDGGSAYAPIKSALADLKAKNRGARPGAALHSIWDELEHMRIAQEDILRYTLDPKWKSPPWPEGYWPETTEKVTTSQWESSIERFFADLEELRSLVRDTGLDLTSNLPHGEGRTYLRQVLLAADHNAYHTGQIVLLRKILGEGLTTAAP
jgi:uncharacterized damage-inducible protein DinB